MLTPPPAVKLSGPPLPLICQVHFGPLFPEPRSPAKRADAAAPALGRPSAGPLGRPSVGRGRATGDSAATAPGGPDAPPPAGSPPREWSEQPSLSRRSVSRWAGAAAASLVTFGHISEIRSLLTHALPGGGGPGGAAGAPLRLEPAAGAAAGELRSGGASYAGSAAGGEGSPEARGSPASSPARQLSPSVSGRTRASAALPNLDTLQVR
jgi:hypothetical protein